MHIFLDAGRGNILAFFELPNSPPMGRDPNTPDWVQHIAFQVADESSRDDQGAAQAEGINVVGPTDHSIFKSIYLFDPSGHRLELAAWTTTPEKQAKLKSVAHDMIDEWTKTKKPPRHAAWLHEQDFAAPRSKPVLWHTPDDRARG